MTTTDWQAKLMDAVGGAGEGDLDLPPLEVKGGDGDALRQLQERRQAQIENLAEALDELLADDDDPAGRLLALPERVRRYEFFGQIKTEVGKLVAKEEVDRALAQGDLDRIAGYPDFRQVSSYDTMTSPQALALPVVGDEHTGIVMRRGHTARILADPKGGKTRLVLELLRSSLTGEPWLGHFPVVPVADGAVVAFLDPELGEDYPWYLQQAFQGLPKEVVDRVLRVDVMAIKAQGWTWASEADRDWLTDQIGGAERLSVDSVLSVLPSGAGREASHSMDAVGEFLDQLKAVQVAAGVSETVVGMHTPTSSGSRSFGSRMWDAKFQALLSVRVGDDSAQTRHLRGFDGRAGVGFMEAPVVQSADGRLVFGGAGGPDGLVGAVSAQALAKIDQVAAALPAVLAGMEPGPSKSKVLDRLRNEAGVSVARGMEPLMWAELQARGLIKLDASSKSHRIWLVDQGSAEG